MARLSDQVRAIVMRERRDSNPGFRLERLARAAFTADSGFAEVLVGGWLMVLRGIMLITSGFSYGRIASLLGHFGITGERMGFLLLAIGVAQILATGTTYLRARAGIAFAGALACLVVWLAYMGQDLEHTTLAWTWAALVASEAVLSSRILLNRQAAGIALFGDENGSAQRREGSGAGSPPAGSPPAGRA